MALLSITATSHGITLTAASTVIFAEVHWTPALMMQAEDRVHRIGQHSKCVNIYYLYGKETLDEVIYPMINLKSMVVANALDGANTDFKIQSKRKAPDYESNKQCLSQQPPSSAKRVQKQQGKQKRRQDKWAEGDYWRPVQEKDDDYVPGTESS